MTQKSMDALREKLSKVNAQLAKSGGGGPSRFWRLTHGSHDIRLLPNLHNRDEPFYEVYYCYDIANRPLVSPVTYGDPCPVYEFAKELQNSGDEQDAELARKLMPKLRVHAPILVRGEQEKEGVKYWGFGLTVYKNLLELLVDEDWGNLTNLKDGHDLKVTYDAPEGSKPFDRKTTVMPKKNACLATAIPEAQESIKNMPTMEEVFKAPTYEEMKKHLEAFINPAEEQEVTTPAVSSGTKTDVNTVEDVDKAFAGMLENDDLFG